MKELKVGLRFSLEEGISFLGLNEVNAEIERGAKVVAIKEGSAIMRKGQEGNESIHLTLSGFSFIVVIDE